MEHWLKRIDSLASTKTALIIAVLLAALGLAGLILTDQAARDHGLVVAGIAVEGGLVRHAYLDGNDFDAQTPVSITLSGGLLAPRSGIYTFTLESAGSAALLIDGQPVLAASGDGLQQASGQIELRSGGVTDLELTYSYAPREGSQPLLELWWQPPGTLFQRRVPSWALFPAGTTSEELAEPGWLRAAGAAARGVMTLGLLGLVLRAAAPIAAGQVSWRMALGLAALFAAALALRLVFNVQRAAHDPSFYTLLAGSDQRAYETFARGLARGTWPGGSAYYFQPGPPYLLYVLHLLVGPGIMAVRIGAAVMDALAALMLADIARRLSGWRAGWIAGGMAACYPAFIFYTSTGLAAPLAVFMAALLLWQLVLLSDALHWFHAVLAGAALAGLIAVRSNMMVVLPLATLWIAFAIPGSRRRALAGLTLAVTVAVYAPIPLHNASVGVSSLSSPIGGQAFYQGNNRDSSGFYSKSQAWEAARLAGEDYLGAFLDDVQAEPLRWAQLLIHKLGMFWQRDELVTNLSYYDNGVHVSSLLAVLRVFNFSVMGGLGLAGMILAALNRRWDAWLLIGFFLITMAAAVLFTPESRIRLPSITALVPLVAYTVDVLIETLKNRRQAAFWRKTGGAAAGAAAVLLLLGAANRWLPLPRLMPSGSLPGEAIPTEITFGEQVRIVGYTLSSAGEAAPGQPIFVTLYWQRLAPIATDYSVSVRLVDRQGRAWGQRDIPVGLVSYRYYPMSRWRDDRIFQEEYLIVPETPDMTLAASVHVIVYDPDTLQALATASGQHAAILAGIRLPSMAAMPVVEPANAASYTFGGWARLTGYDYRRTYDALELTLYWSVLATPPQDYTTALTVLDENGQVVTRTIKDQLGGLLPTGFWRAGDMLADSYRIPLPPGIPGGVYAVDVAFEGGAAPPPVEDETGANLPGGAARLEGLVLP
jgi:hypothetical protein